MRHFFSIIGTTILFIFLFPSFILAEKQNAVSDDFLNKLEEKLQDEVNYYNSGSIQIENSLTMDGTIFKLITTDDPKTEENEEKTEEYSSNFTVALVKYEQKRDSIFFFDKYDLVYYDNNNQEFLIHSNVIGNPEAEQFFNENITAVHKVIQPFSTLLVLALISILLLTPILLVIFHNKAKSTALVIKDPKVHTLL